MYARRQRNDLQRVPQTNVAAASRGLTENVDIRVDGPAKQPFPSSPSASRGNIDLNKSRSKLVVSAE